MKKEENKCLLGPYFVPCHGSMNRHPVILPSRLMGAQDLGKCVEMAAQRGKDQVQEHWKGGGGTGLEPVNSALRNALRNPQIWDSK